MDTLDSSDSLGLGVREERTAMDEVVFVKGKPIMLDQREATVPKPNAKKKLGNQKKAAIPENTAIDQYVAMPDAPEAEDVRQSDEDWASSLAMKANQEIDRVREKTARARGRAKSAASAAESSYVPPESLAPNRGGTDAPRQWL